MTQLAPFAIVVLMSTLAVSQTLTPPPAITDPKQITAKPDANVEQSEESLSLERLYMTGQIGDSAWSPGAAHRALAGHAPHQAWVRLGPVAVGRGTDVCLAQSVSPSARAV